MHPIAIVLLVMLLYVIAFCPRRWALCAMVIGVLYLTQGQVFQILGANFYAIRVLEFALLVRVMARQEFSWSNLNRIDGAFLVLYAYATIVFLLRSPTGKMANIAEAMDALCCYFGFRGLIKSEQDFKWILRALIFLLIPYVLLLGFERVTGRNPFAFMGGVSEGVFVRDDKARCMGSFRYPVSLGTFGATFLALYMGMFSAKEDRRRACLGILMCLWIVWVSNSGGSFSATGAAIVGWMLWRLQKKMRMVRWAIIAGIVSLSFVMKAPVWYIMDRVTFGGSSWHRAYLIDVAVNNMDKWWAVGMPLVDTASWFPYTLNGGADITNQYLVFGLSTGIGSITLFILLLSRAFGQIGRAIVKLGSALKRRTTRFMLWGLGVMLGVHVVNWFGISYFDQIYVIWFLQLAAMASITDEILKRPVQNYPAVSSPVDGIRPQTNSQQPCHVFPFKVKWLIERKMPPLGH